MLHLECKLCIRTVRPFHFSITLLQVMSFKQEIEKLTHVSYEKWSFIVNAWAMTEDINLEEPGEKDSKLQFFLATAVSDEVIPTISNLKTGK